MLEKFEQIYLKYTLLRKKKADSCEIGYKQKKSVLINLSYDV
jgi:hypothetical protein